MKYANSSCRESGSMFAGVNTPSSRFNTHHANIFIVYERMKEANSITSSSHTGYQEVRKLSFCFNYLFTRFVANYPLKISDNSRIGMGANDRTNYVMSGFDICHPVANGFVGGICKSAASRHDRYYFCTKKAHPVNIQSLPPHIFLSHEDVAFKTESCCSSSTCYSVLSRAGFSYYPFLTQLLSDKRLSHCIVYIVCPCMVKIFPFQIDPGSSQVCCESFCKIERGRPSTIL